MAGRFAPSPTGDLHLGNLRTALLAWLVARTSGRSFLLRFEDLDRVTSSAVHEQRQRADLHALGIDHDGETVRQSERFDLYRDALATLEARDLVYRCFCTRREIAEEIAAASAAPHGQRVPERSESPDQPELLIPDGAYPGTCATLTRVQAAERLAAGRRPALRLRARSTRISGVDQVLGRFTGVVDDVVLQRADGVPAYNLAVVVDDALQGVDQVVRGDDLLSSTPRQMYLQQLLGVPTPEYFHVPLVLGADGARLAKRHGAVTLDDLARRGVSATSVLQLLAASVGLSGAATAQTAADLRADLSGAEWHPLRLRGSATVLDEFVDAEPTSHSADTQGEWSPTRDQ